VRAFLEEIRPKISEIAAQQAGVRPSQAGIQDVGAKAKRSSANESARSKRSMSLASATSASEDDGKPSRRSKKQTSAVERVLEEDDARDGDREEVCVVC
jgi:hypothetical protein